MNHVVDGGQRIGPSSSGFPSSREFVDEIRGLGMRTKRHPNEIPLYKNVLGLKFVGDGFLNIDVRKLLNSCSDESIIMLNESYCVGLTIYERAVNLLLTYRADDYDFN